MSSITDDFRNPQFGANTDVDTSAEAVGSDTRLRAIQFKADPDNTDVIYVSTNASVSASNGWPLSAGQETIVFVGTNNLTDWYTIADSANQTLHYLYFE